jgi:hypothetical protein
MKTDSEDYKPKTDQELPTEESEPVETGEWAREILKHAGYGDSTQKRVMAVLDRAEANDMKGSSVEDLPLWQLLLLANSIGEDPWEVEEPKEERE